MMLLRITQLNLRLLAFQFGLNRSILRCPGTGPAAQLVPYPGKDTARNRPGNDLARAGLRLCWPAEEVEQSHCLALGE